MLRRLQFTSPITTKTSSFLTFTRNFATQVSLPDSDFDLSHSVFNQATPLQDFDALKSCPRYSEALQTGVNNNRILDEEAQLVRDYGVISGKQSMLEAAAMCNKHTPTFAAFDRYGHRMSGRAEFHPSYHTLMSSAIENRVPSLPWTSKSKGKYVARGILSMMHYQLEMGTSCPLTMTFAGVAPLKRALHTLPKTDNNNINKNDPRVTELSTWIEKLTNNSYDSRDVHISEKSGATIGMSMTEKQGGSDVRSNTTIATPINNSDSFYTLRGHKWFTSAPMCDAFLVLAQTASSSSTSTTNNNNKNSGAGLSCFLVPRWTAPGVANTGLQFQRLKEKMADKSNASSEVEYHDAVGFLVGPPGQGVKTIIEMVNLTRLDCLIGSAGLMHRACIEAVNHVSKRSAFGGVLCQKPLMMNVLSDLAIESEAANALGLRMCEAFDATTKEEATFARIGVAVSKYFVCKRAPAVSYEAMECLGGNGFTEDFIMSRIFRQSPLNAIWEGSGNVIVLDVFRAIAREPSTIDALRSEISSLVSNDASDVRLQKYVSDFDKQVTTDLKSMSEIEGRCLVEKMARLLQASALKRTCGINGANKFVYDAFVETRILAPSGNCIFGTLPKKFVSEELIGRITPQ